MKQRNPFISLMLSIFRSAIQIAKDEKELTKAVNDLQQFKYANHKTLVGDPFNMRLPQRKLRKRLRQNPHLRRSKKYKKYNRK